VVVVGCKRDVVDAKKDKHFELNAKVLTELKNIDLNGNLDYFEAGLSLNKGTYKVSQDDVQLFVSKVFEDVVQFGTIEGSNQAYGYGSGSSSSGMDSDASDGEYKTRKVTTESGIIGSFGSAFASYLTGSDKKKEGLPM